MTTKDRSKKQEPHSTAGINAPSDDELLRRIKGGEHDLWALLDRRHREAIKLRLRRFGCEGQDADDVLQETALKVLSRADQYKPIGKSALPWIFQIARNEWLMTVRSKRRYQLSFSGSEPAGVPETVSNETADVAYEQWETIKKVLVDPLDEEIAWLLWCEGFTIEETAAQLGIPDSSVKNHARRIRQRAVSESQVSGAFATFFPAWERGFSHTGKISSASRLIRAATAVGVGGALLWGLRSLSTSSSTSEPGDRSNLSWASCNNRRGRTGAFAPPRGGDSRQSSDSESEQPSPHTFSPDVSTPEDVRVASIQDIPSASIRRLPSADELWSQFGEQDFTIVRNHQGLMAEEPTRPIPTRAQPQRRGSTISFVESGGMFGECQMAHLDYEVLAYCIASMPRQDDPSNKVRHTMAGWMRGNYLIMNMWTSPEDQSSFFTANGSLILNYGNSAEPPECRVSHWTDINAAGIAQRVCSTNPTLQLCAGRRFANAHESHEEILNDGGSQALGVRVRIRVDVDPASWRGRVDFATASYRGGLRDGQHTFLEPCISTDCERHLNYSTPVSDYHTPRMVLDRWGFSESHVVFLTVDNAGLSSRRASWEWRTSERCRHALATGRDGP